MKFASWNINSINLRKETVLNWMNENKIDVLGLQETKCETDKFPNDFFHKNGYFTEVIGQKSYNGVAIISKHPIQLSKSYLPNLKEKEAQARYLEIEINNFIFTSIYVPNGNPINTEKFAYKKDWLDCLIKHSNDLLSFEKPVILAGDFNVIPDAIDCWDEQAWENDALATPFIRKQFRIIKHQGYFDAFRLINNDKSEWSFWDYQNGSWNKDYGIRIDHFLINSYAADIIKNCTIDKRPRGKEKPSDHTPIVLEF
tara:strand:+ start:625 stop:1392 length:768 start_codon:yes stop_codon:yes gene_type:complete